MVSYTCDRCKKTFNKKSNYEYHINRKIKCKDIVVSSTNSDITPINSIVTSINSIATSINSDVIPQNIGLPPITKTRKEHICKDCCTKFSSSSNLTRHRDGRCKHLNVIEKEKESSELKKNEELNELKKKIIELTERINEMESKNMPGITIDTVIANQTNNTTSTIIDKQINNTINNTINVISFHDDSWKSTIADDTCKKILKTGFKAVPNLVEHVHCNSSYPLYQNCSISNLRSNHGTIHDGKSWKATSSEDIIQKLKEDKQDYLIEKYDEFGNSLDDATRKKFDRYLNEKDTESVINQQKNDIKLLLYNKGNTLKKARKDIAK